MSFASFSHNQLILKFNIKILPSPDAAGGRVEFIHHKKGLQTLPFPLSNPAFFV